MKLYSGIDLHSNNSQCAIVNEVGKLVFERRFVNELPVILKGLEPFKEELVAIGVESTYNWYWLVDGLMEAGYPVKLANPSAMEQYEGLKNANDKTDARFLAEMLRLDILPVGYIYPKQDRPVRDLLRRRLLIVQHRTAMILSLESMLMRQTGMAFNLGEILKLDTAEWEVLLGSDEFLLFTARQQMDLIRVTSEKIKMIEKKVLEKAKLRPDYEKLLTIPGVGMILALTIMLETGDIGRFPKVGNYTSYCRCAEADHWSNEKKKGEHNQKNGNRYLSWAFVEAAHHMIRCCPPAHSFYQRKLAKINGAVATKALASKLSKCAYYVMKNQEVFELRKIFG